MAQVATIYTIEPWVRTPADLLHDPSPGRTAAPRPHPVNKRVWASLAEDPLKVIDDAFAEGLRRDPDRKRQWVCCVDGNTDQLRSVKKAAKKAGVKVTIIIDLIHVIEYLWRAAHCFHEDPKAAEQWVEVRLRALLEGRTAGALVKDLRRWAVRRKLGKLEPDRTDGRGGAGGLDEPTPKGPRKVVAAS